MNFISICSGIEAASVAFGPLGWKALAFAEIEPFPCAVLAHHYPDVPNYGDMTAFRQWPEQIFESADAIVGGPPCQAFSVAGLRKGLDDARGNLTLTYAEMINHADAIRLRHGKPPVIVLYENVPGLLSDKSGAYGCFLAALAGEDDPLEPPGGGGWSNAGYVSGPQRTIAWRTLDAQYFGVAQRRRRVFVISSARKDFDPATVLFEFGGVRRDIAPSRQTREGITGGVEIGPGGGRFTDLNPTLDTRAKDGPIRNQLAGAVIQPYAVANCLTARMHKGINSTLDEGQTPVVTHTLRGEGFDASEDGTGRGTPLVTVAMRESGPGYWVQDSISDTLRTDSNRPGKEGTVIGQPIAFSSKDYGGDAATDLSPTLRAMPHDGSHANGGGQMAVATFQQSSMKGRGTIGYDDSGIAKPVKTQVDGQMIHAAMQVRRLTPVECERLQGFPNINETIRVEICFDHQKSAVNVVVKCRKSQSNALNVGESESKQLVSIANWSSSTNQASQEPLVALHVHQQSGGRSLALRNAQKLTSFASSAEKPSASPLFMQAESFAATLACIQQTLALTASVGKEASHPSISLSLTEPHGNQSAGTFGGVTEACVSDVNCAANEARFTTSSRGHVTVICDSQIATLLCSVMTATSGFIQNGILPESFSVELTTQSDYTAIPWRKKPASDCPDGPRYKALGNSWAVPNVRWIGARIQDALQEAAQIQQST